MNGNKIKTSCESALEIHSRPFLQLLQIPGSRDLRQPLRSETRAHNRLTSSSTSPPPPLSPSSSPSSRPAFLPPFLSPVPNGCSPLILPLDLGEEDTLAAGPVAPGRTQRPQWTNDRRMAAAVTAEEAKERANGGWAGDTPFRGSAATAVSEEGRKEGGRRMGLSFGPLSCLSIPLHSSFSALDSAWRLLSFFPFFLFFILAFESDQGKGGGCNVKQLRKRNGWY